MSLALRERETAKKEERSNKRLRNGGLPRDINIKYKYE